MRTRIGVLGVLTGLIGMIAALPLTVSAFQALGIVSPADPLRWELVMPSGSTVQDATDQRTTLYVGANADKVIANPNDSTAGSGVNVVDTCALKTGSTYTCTSQSSIGTLIGTSSPGSYKVAVVTELKRADGTYAPRVASAACTFQFADTRTSVPASNLRIEAR